MANQFSKIQFMKNYNLIFLIAFFLKLTILSAQNLVLFEEVNSKEIEDRVPYYHMNFIHVHSSLSCNNDEIDSLFINPVIIDFFSSNFKCFSISIDSTKCSINNILNTVKPGFYFIDSSFSLIHKHLLSPKSSLELIKIGNIALDSSANYKSMIYKYKQGIRDFSFLLQYLKTRRNASEILSSEIDEAISQIDLTKPISYAIMEFIYDYFFCKTYDKGYYYFDIQSIPFNILLKNRNQFLQFFDTAQINFRIKALIDFGLHRLISNMDLMLIEQSAVFVNDPPNDISLKNLDGDVLLLLKGSVNDTISKTSALSAFYYLQNGDTLNYFALEKYFMELSKENAMGLFFMANYYFRNIDTKEYLEKAYKIIQIAYHLDNNNFRITGLMAEIVYYKKDYDKALLYIDEAINLFIENGINPSQFEAMKTAILNNKNAKLY